MEKRKKRAIKLYHKVMKQTKGRGSVLATWALLAGDNEKTKKKKSAKGQKDRRKQKVSKRNSGYSPSKAGKSFKKNSKAL